MGTPLGPLTPGNVITRVARDVPAFDLNLNQIETNIQALRTALNAAIADFNTRIAALEAVSSGTPSLSNFSITAPARVNVGTDLSGQAYEAKYDVFVASLVTAARIVAFQEVPGGGATTVLVADAARLQGTNTQPFTFPTGADFATEGNRFVIRVELYTSGQTPGTDPPAVTGDQVILAQAAPRTDLFYWGAVVDPTIANIDVNTLESQTQLDGDVVIPTFTENSHIVFLSPATAARITGISFGGFQQIGAFPLVEDPPGTPTTIDVGGTNYVVNRSTNLLLPSFFSGETATITR